MTRSLSLLFLLSLLLGSPVAGQEVDFAKMIQAPGYLFVGKEIKVGYRMERETEVAGIKTREFMAIVGETEDAWEVETNQGLGGYASATGGKGLVLALVVDKKTLQVLIGRLGKVGEELKEVKIMKMKAPPEPEASKPTREEDYELKSGKKIPAEVYVTEVGGKTYTSFLGKKGSPLEGVLLRYEGADGYELTEDPQEEVLELEDKDAEGKPKTLKAIKTVYGNGYTYYTTQDPLAKAFHAQMLRMESKTFTLSVRSLRTDAKKTLSWK